MYRENISRSSWAWTVFSCPVVRPKEHGANKGMGQSSRIMQLAILRRYKAEDTQTYLCTSTDRQRSKFGKIASPLRLQMLDDFVEKLMHLLGEPKRIVICL